jgi:hypothetical protein
LTRFGGSTPVVSRISDRDVDMADMNLEEYPDQDGTKVWLSKRETQELLGQFEETHERIAASLAARCGLRSGEVLDVAPENVVETDAGQMLRIWESAKTGRYRETPIPPNLATTIRTVGDVRDAPTDEPVVDVSTRTGTATFPRPCSSSTPLYCSRQVRASSSRATSSVWSRSCCCAPGAQR